MSLWLKYNDHVFIQLIHLQTFWFVCLYVINQPLYWFWERFDFTPHVSSLKMHEYPHPKNFFNLNQRGEGCVHKKSSQEPD